MKYIRNYFLYYGIVASALFYLNTQNPIAIVALIISLALLFYVKKKNISATPFLLIAAAMAGIYTTFFIANGMEYKSITYAAMGVFGCYLFIFVPEIIRAIRLGDITKMTDINDKIERLDKLFSEGFFKKDDTYYYLTKASYLYQLGRISEALESSSHLRERELDEKKLYALHFNLAEYYIALKNFDKAMENINILADPLRFAEELQKESFVNYIFAKYYYAKGELDTGRAYLEKASDLKTITYFILAGKYAIKDDDTLTAIRHLEGATSSNFIFYEVDEARTLLAKLRKKYERTIRDDDTAESVD